MNILAAKPVRGGQDVPRRLEDGADGETAHVFGDGLVGVLHRSAGSARCDTAVILLNAGMVHRVGPHRGAVQLARMLAAGGFAVLRIDQSGLGDSPLSSKPSADLRQQQLRAAMDLLATQVGVRRFVVGGICSAADNAFHVAAVEPRIHGLLLFDGLAYRTPGYWWRHLLPRAFQPGKAWRWWRARRANRLDLADFRDFPARHDAVAQLADMVARDVRLLFVFTGGAYHYFNHAGQLRASLGAAARARQVSMAFWPECDHTFYLRRDRARLQHTVLSWLEREFGTATQDAAAGDA